MRCMAGLTPMPRQSLHQDRNGISAIITARDRPAAPGDPRDNDGNGMIDVLAARQGVIKCALPGCAVPSGAAYRSG